METISLNIKRKSLNNGINKIKTLLKKGGEKIGFIG